MSRTVLALIGAFALALLAGAMLGWATSPSRGPAHEARGGGPPPGWADELNLTDAQRDQLRQIWDRVHDSVHGSMDQDRNVRHAFDRAVYDLLTDEQKKQYAKTRQQYADVLVASRARLEQSFADADRQSEAVLTPEQKQKFQTLVKDRRPGPSTGPATVDPVVGLDFGPPPMHGGPGGAFMFGPPDGGHGHGHGPGDRGGPPGDPGGPAADRGG